MIRNEVFKGDAVVSAEIIDLDAATISFEDKGVVTSTRPLTADEVARYAPPEPTSDEKLAAARAVLDQIQALPAPVLTADVVDMLDDLRGVL
jgi:hypothetical protein